MHSTKTTEPLSLSCFCVSVDEIPFLPCSQDLALRWHTEIDSPILATPLITDLFSDGRKDVIVPGFHRAISVLDGRTGGRDTMFEGSLHSTMHASPVLFDIDMDGVPDIVAASYDGKIQFMKDNGEQAAFPLVVPHLRVRRDWYKGLDPDPIDHSHPDVGADADDSGVGERSNSESDVRRRRTLLSLADDNSDAQEDVQDPVDARHSGRTDEHPSKKKKQTVLPAREISEDAAASFADLFGNDNTDTDALKERKARGANLKEIWREKQAKMKGKGKANWLNKEDLRMHRLDDDEEEDESFDIVTNTELHPGLRMEDYDDEVEDDDDDIEDENEGDYEEKAALWRDDWEDDDLEEDYIPLHFESDTARKFVWIDPHVLATPCIGDIDNDGHEELVVPVSYFFDPETYAVDSIRAEITVGKDGDIDKYMASGVVVFDLFTRSLKWSQHLDLSTRYTRYKALAQGSPTLADIDGDGRLEVVIGTSMGFIYVLDPANGNALEGWPIQMGDVQGSVAVGDIDADGKLELIAGDARGSIAAFRNTGEELWERHLGSSIGVGATLADIDSDGDLEVLLGTFDGRVYALNGRNGVELPGFPFRSSGRIAAPILPIKLSDRSYPYMELAFTSHDGLLYVLDSESVCAHTVDLGEPSFSMVLAEDIAGSGVVDLLATTSGGSVYAFRTSSRYHPLKSWPSQSNGNGAACCTSRWNWEGIYATATSRIPRDVRGVAVPVRFTIMDRRPILKKNGSDLVDNELVAVRGGRYKVSIVLSGVGAKEMNAGDAPVIGMSDVFNASGTYTMEIPCPRTRTTATVRLQMQDESGAIYVDEFALSFHMHFYRLLKWALVGPLACTAVAALLGGKALKDFMPQLPS